MKPIFKRPRAEADLVDIWNFIAEDSEAQADVFIDELDEKLRSLAENPHIGRVRNELAENLRSFPVGPFVIFYLPLVDGIEVVRVLHGARDIGAIFRSYK